MRDTLHEQNAQEFGFNPHKWVYGYESRRCVKCGARETYWDDSEYPINPCDADEND